MNNNIGVAVLDTGIYKHIDFGNRIIAFKDFINNRAFPYDDSGHGTHVSGIIAGDGYSPSVSSPRHLFCYILFFVEPANTSATQQKELKSKVFS